jgi:hypothetical protein
LLRLAVAEDEDSTILGNYGIDEIEVAYDTSQIRKYSAGSCG